MNLNNLKRNVSNIFGWTTSRKILVIESDDWGSIRMPSMAAYARLSKQGVQLGCGDAARYNLNDTLATVADLTALFETLQKCKDSKGNPAVFTAVSVVGNPDFDKIRQHKFEEYFYEPFTHTLEKYYGNNAVYSLWKEGIQNRLFVPQFHGREHLNVAAWMNALQKNERDTALAFNEGCWGFNNQHPFGVNYQAAFDLTDKEDLNYQHLVIKDGLALFEKLFGYKASFFVPPNGPFNNELEITAAEAGVKFMSGSKMQHESLGAGKTRKRFHYLGQKNKYNQVYLTRNCFFEPSQGGKDWVKTCLNEIDIAFRWHKPATISSHRVNYIGALNLSNRKKGLLLLEDLLKKIILKWPEIEFITSAELGDIIVDKNKK
jgi:hypothetical protein